MSGLPAHPRADAPAPRRGPLLDPGWLFLLAGIVLVAAVVLIPAQRDLDDAQHFLDRAAAAEHHRGDRLARYLDYLDHLDREDEGTILALAAMQMNQAPLGSVLLMPAASDARSASIFAHLEPPPLVHPERRRQPSTLESWCLADRSRLILSAAGAMLILIGLLPPTIRR